MWPSLYHAPGSLADLHGLLHRYGAGARMFVGGTDVIVRLRHGAMKPAALIDLKRVQELSDRLEQHGDSIRIGARVTMTTILGDERIRRWFPALLEAAAVVGSIQIRNRATLVGNVCNASPAADTVPVLLVHGAVANITGPAGERRVPLSGFFVGPGRTVLESGELVVSLDLPIPAGSVGAAFGRLTRRRGVDLAVINLCVLLEAGRPARMAFGAVAPTPILSVDATGALDGSTEWTDASGRALASMLMSTRPISDVRGGRDYRAAMLPVLARRAWQTARLRLSEPATREPPTREPRDPRTRDPRTRDPRTRDPRTRDPRTRDPRTPEPRTCEPAPPACQRARLCRPGARAPDAARPASRLAAADWNERVLRRRRVRRLHGPGRWRGGLQLPGDGRRDGRPRDHDDRRARVRWTPRSPSGGVRGVGRRAVRVLHPRDDHVRARAARSQSPADSGGSAGRALGKPVSLRRLQPDRRRRAHLERSREVTPRPGSGSS